MKKIIFLIQGIVLLAIGMSYGQAKITPDSVAAANAQPAPGLQWSRSFQNGKPVYYMFDPKLGKSYLMYTGQYVNYLFLGKQEATALYQPIGNYLTTETDPLFSANGVPYIGADKDVFLNTHNLSGGTLQGKNLVVAGGNLNVYAPATGNGGINFISSDYSYLYGNLYATINGIFSTSDVTVNPGQKFNGPLNGNASSVTNGVYTTGSYSDPNWLTSLSQSKLIYTGTHAQYIDGTGAYAAFPSFNNYVPYTGATTNINLGANSISSTNNIIGNGIGGNAVYIHGGGVGDIKLTRDSTYDTGGLKISGITTYAGNKYNMSLSAKGFTSSHNVVFQDKDYTGVADLTDITTATSKSVPYTGANKNVNLGYYGLQANRLATPPAIGDISTAVLYLYNGDVPVTRLSSDSTLANGILRISNGGSAGIRIGGVSPFTSDRKVLFRDQDITVAGLSDLTSVVPYSGATADVNLGNHQIAANSFVKTGGTSNQYLMADGSTTTFVPSSGNGSSGITTLTTYGSAGSAYISGNNLNIPTPTLAGLGGEPFQYGFGLVRKNGATISYDTTSYQPKITGTGIPYFTKNGSIVYIPTAYGVVGQTLATRDQYGNSAFNTLTAAQFKVPGGTSSQFLMADGSTTNNPYFTQLGIGTTTPNTTLDVRGQIMNGGQDSNLDPSAPTGNISFLQGSARMLMGWNRTAAQGEADFIASRLDQSKPDAQAVTGGFAFYDFDDNGNQKQLMRLNGLSGNVGIGVMNPSNKLDVAGTVHAEEVLVDRNGFSDYVFDKDYKLPDLTEVKAFVEKNHHLADMPSENEVVNKGLKIGDVTNVLTKKIEELTLYIINQDKRIKLLERQRTIQKHR